MKSPVYPEGIITSQDRFRKLLDQRSYSFDGTAVLGVGYQRKNQAALTKYLIIFKLLLAHLYPLEVILELPLIPAPAPPPHILLPICLPILGSWLHHRLYHSPDHFLALFLTFRSLKVIQCVLLVSQVTQVVSKYSQLIYLFLKSLLMSSFHSRPTTVPWTIAIHPQDHPYPNSAVGLQR